MIKSYSETLRGVSSDPRWLTIFSSNFPFLIASKSLLVLSLYFFRPALNFGASL